MSYSSGMGAKMSTGVRMWKDARRQWAYQGGRQAMGSYARNSAPSHRYTLYSPDQFTRIRNARIGRYGTFQGLGSVELGLLAVL